MAFDVEPDPQAPPPDMRRWVWTRPQQRVIALLVLIATLVLAWRAWNRPALIPDPLPLFPGRYNDLADRIDPNVATVAELGVLPGIGPAKAEAIVAYRESQTAPAFRSPSDLTNVYGIGDVTASKLAPYLMFQIEPGKD